MRANPRNEIVLEPYDRITEERAQTLVSIPRCTIDNGEISSGPVIEIKVH